MFFWLREIVGWVLIAISLYLIRMGVGFVSDVTDPRIVEGSVIVFAAGALLRVGTLLIRVSTAARICLKEEKS